jgi:hypothetical protein
LSEPNLGTLVVIVLFMSLVLVVELETWVALIALPILALLGYCISRPSAVHPDPPTVRGAVIALTPFRVEDYRAGLWERSDIADRVRLILSENCGVPFESITEDTEIMDLLE